MWYKTGIAAPKSTSQENHVGAAIRIHVREKPTPRRKRGQRKENEKETAHSKGNET